MPAITWTRRPFAMLALLVAGPALIGCQQADYAADVVNRTPQPVFAQLFTKEANGAMAGMSRRLGPGDRASIGPVRAYVNRGAYISVDTLSNPGRPVDADLLPGTSFFQIIQDGQDVNSPIRIVPKQ